MTDSSIGSGVRLLPATPADTCFVRRLFIASRPALSSLPEPLQGMQFTGWENMLKEQYPDAERWILYADADEADETSEPVGAALVHFPVTGAIRLVDLAVVPAFQRRGIGTAFLQDLQEQARERNAPIRLFVSGDNSDAQRLYRRLGFRPLLQFLAESSPLIYQEMIWTPF